MKLISHISRLLVGTLFIFSGIIKANDPYGFSYKLEEYFVEFGMTWDWLLEIAMPLAAFICILEIVLGIATLIGFKMKEVSTLLLLQIIFFTILTFSSAVFGLVKSCGCFGDAIPLTPWQSFYKDLVLLVLIGVIFFERKKIKPFIDLRSDLMYFLVSCAIMVYFSTVVDWFFPLIFTAGALLVNIFIKVASNRKKAALYTTILTTLASIFFSVYVIRHLPIVDFRPYAEGKNIPEQMTLPEGAKEPVYETRLVYENTETGEVKEFSQENYPWEDTTWVWKETKTELIEEGDSPKITDFSISDYDGNDHTDQYLNDPGYVFMLIAYNISETDEGSYEKINAFADNANGKGAKFIGLTASGYDEVESFRHEHQLMFPFYVTDEITLKTIIRSNPGLILLNDGKVLAKWHHNDIPSFKKVAEKYMK